MNLKELTAGLQLEIIGSQDKEIAGMAYDSRKVKENYLFFALPGTKDDGERYIAQAVKNGAIAVVSRKRSEAAAGVTMLIFSQPRVLMGTLAARFYGNPSEKLFVLGITGTNGKTTITYLLESIFTQRGEKIAIIGTIANRFGDEVLPAERTTPESLDLQMLLDKALAKGFKVVAMEVSSHALAQSRVEGCEFDVGIFTNLTRDHLDYHQTMENYLLAKSELFRRLYPQIKGNKFAIINLDDPSAVLLQKVSAAPVFTYSLTNRSANFLAQDIALGRENSQFNLLVNIAGKALQKEPIKLHLVGSYNVANALAAAAAAFCCGVELNEIAQGLEKIENIPGRFEKINLGQPFSCIVDYAHTSDGLEKALTACRELKPARLIAVFGCGGNRDHSKRSLMGEIASRLSDFVFVTSDNPRSENPEKIIREIEAGIIEKNRHNYKIVIERRQAIEEALSFARSGDLILLAGKGHEQDQVFADHIEHFDDREVVREIGSRFSRDSGPEKREPKK